ncbi:MAG: DUF5711 family protein [Firmicutes bacterium]|nr:DUF5711 family protein [Bacillota bacterium]
MRKKKNKIEPSLVIFIIVVLLGALAYQNRGLLRANLESSKQVFAYESTSQLSFDASKGNLLALDSDGLICLSEEGRKKWNIVHQISNPRMNVSGGYSLVFDKGGKEVHCYLRNSKLWEHTTEQPIITAKINKNGCAVVVSHAAGYKAKVEVIANEGEPIYEWLLSEYYVIDVDISPNAKTFAAAVLRPDSAEVTSSVIVVDIDGERIKGEMVFNGSLVFDILYQKNGSIIALSEDRLVGVSSKGEKLWDVNFEERQLSSYKLGYDTGSVLAFLGSRNNSIVQIYGKKGQKIGEYISDEKVNDVDIFDNTIAVAEKGCVVMLGQSGLVTVKTEQKHDIKQIMLLSRHRVAAVGNNNIEIIKP